jgi:hypothetical protein
MEWLGALERAFATSLYPLRVPIAIGLAIAVVAGIAVASRRGWIAAARRNPGRSAALAIAILVVSGPIAWYLGSPLFIRTSLTEPAPIVGADATDAPMTSPLPATSAGPGMSHKPPTSDDPPLEPAATPALAAIRSGTFKGADDFHFGSGEARLIETAPGEWIVRFEDFSVRNGPDLFVYLSPDADGYADGALELGRLKATDGSFNTKVPARSDVAGLRSVVIWCKQFGVQFAVAKLR